MTIIVSRQCVDALQGAAMAALHVHIHEHLSDRKPAVQELHPLRSAHRGRPHPVLPVWCARVPPHPTHARCLRYAHESMHGFPGKGMLSVAHCSAQVCMAATTASCAALASDRDLPSRRECMLHVPSTTAECDHAMCSDEDGIPRPTHETNVYVEEGKEGSTHGGSIIGRRARPTTPRAAPSNHTNGY